MISTDVRRRLSEMKPKIAISQTTIANTGAVTPLTRLSHDVEYVP